MSKLKNLCLLLLPLLLSGCVLWEGELMEIDGRYEKVYTDLKGRRYYSYKGRKKYLDEARDVRSMDKDQRILREAERFDSRDY